MIQQEQGDDVNSRPDNTSTWKYRLARHHAPLALSSVGLLVLFLSIKPFTHEHPFKDVFSGAFPRQPPENGAVRSGAKPTAAPEGLHAAMMRRHGGASSRSSHGPAQASAADHGNEHNPQSLVRRLSTTTGYVALVLLAVTLLTGPLNIALGRRNPVSSYFRRDA